MARWRSAAVDLDAGAEEAAAERYQLYRWDSLHVTDAADHKPEEDERFKAVWAEQGRLNAMSLTTVERLDQLEQFLDANGWLARHIDEIGAR